jgi:hypothetical protein
MQGDKSGFWPILDAHLGHCLLSLSGASMVSNSLNKARHMVAAHVKPPQFEYDPQWVMHLTI